MGRIAANPETTKVGRGNTRELDGFSPGKICKPCKGDEVPTKTSGKFNLPRKMTSDLKTYERNYISFLDSKVQDSGGVCRGRNPKTLILIDLNSLGYL